ncbi:hypothetical protein [Paenibacillus ginsengarvi]|uniref:Glucosamine inositolphosphorylceramide transferase 1 N-terminal domain-containing protein n=1 Tax=Paenibacillus ginsengarvi TaxID=400777 RepID=A0A3B0CLQ2_9BACL|nr:hypothetical protein [Paenibacillus ginsengarvi]RKN85668.1 hypothetical protein D7M11_08300 [Paenibacillus ginsengarvi]
MKSAANNGRLKIGIMIESLTVHNWVEKIITDIVYSKHMELCIVLVKEKSVKSIASTKRKPTLSCLLYSAYCKLDYKLHRKRVPFDAFAPKSIEPLLKQVNVEIRSVSPNRGGETSIIPDLDQIAIKQYKLDVIVKIGFPAMCRDMIHLAKYGVWSYEHDDIMDYYRSYSFFWEIYEKNVRTETSLQITSNRANDGKVIYRSVSPTVFRSLFLNRNATCWKASEFVHRRLNDLYTRGWDYITSLDTYNESFQPATKKVKMPSNLQMIKFLSSLTLYQIRLRIKLKIMKEQWFIAFKNKHQSKFEMIKPPAGRFYADPFILMKNGRNYVFFEDYINSLGRGVISYIEFEPENNTYSEPKVVLETPYHLSYPFLFEWQDQIYMIPESSGNKTIELYRATQFPVEWTLEKVIMNNIKAVDTTIVEYNHKFWLFANIASKGASTLDELHLFYSDSPLGEWKPHPMNPIVSDAGNARPAGNLLKKDGKLIRPSQNCLINYGYSIIFNEVEILNEHYYKEKPISEIKPNWTEKLVATHTYNLNEDFELLDGKLLKFEW